MASIFGFGKSNAQKKASSEEPKGVIGRYYENNIPVIMRFVNELPDKKILDRFQYLTVISWKYDGSNNNGMPLKEINQKMIFLEDALEMSMQSSNIFTHAYSRTGNNLKEFVFYSTNQNDFMEMLNKALEKHEKYPIEITFYEDKEWTEFKKVLEDFKQK
jgi:hypothetical protein